MSQATMKDYLNSYIRAPIGRDLTDIEGLITEFRNGNACAERHMGFISSIIEYVKDELYTASLEHTTALLQILEQSAIASLNKEIRDGIFRSLELITKFNPDLTSQEIAIGCFLLSLPNSPSARTCEILLPRATSQFKRNPNWAVWQLLAYIASNKAAPEYSAHDALSDLRQLSSSNDFLARLRSRNSLLQRLGTDYIDIEDDIVNLRPSNPIPLEELDTRIKTHAKIKWSPKKDPQSKQAQRKQNA